jgi:hypothetical protein
MKTTFLTGLMLMVVACSGGQTSGGEGGGEKQAELKRQAASSQGNSSSDLCAEHDWYGDQVCDTFCLDRDVDCTLEDDDVMCLTYIEESNGTCDREPGSPCIQQDPDCVGSIEPTPPDPIACTAIVRLADGVCESDPNDPCMAYQDEDCWKNDGGGAIPTEPDPSNGGTCKVQPEPADGVCKGNGDPNDPCTADPDCLVVVCPAILEAPNGSCDREPNDPCRSQDPDCNVK